MDAHDATFWLVLTVLAAVVAAMIVDTGHPHPTRFWCDQFGIQARDCR
ncbi:hypothetical protein [Halovulum sp. GXIMD14793]